MNFKKRYSLNVIPTEAEAGFDIRIPPTEVDSFLALLREKTTAKVILFSYYRYFL